MIVCDSGNLAGRLAFSSGPVLVGQVTPGLPVPPDERHPAVPTALEKQAPAAKPAQEEAPRTTERRGEDAGKSDANVQFTTWNDVRRRLCPRTRKSWRLQDVTFSHFGSNCFVGRSLRARIRASRACFPGKPSHPGESSGGRNQIETLAIRVGLERIYIRQVSYESLPPPGQAVQVWWMVVDTASDPWALVRAVLRLPW